MHSEKQQRVFVEKNVPRFEAKSRASRIPVARAMCRFCDAIGPICPWVTSQDWLSRGGQDSAAGGQEGKGEDGGGEAHSSAGKGRGLGAGGGAQGGRRGREN